MTVARVSSNFLDVHKHWLEKVSHVSVLRTVVFAFGPKRSLSIFAAMNRDDTF